MFRAKLFLKNEKIKLLLISSAVSIILLIINQKPDIFRNLSDFFCIIGLIHILVGSIRYIRNVGLFKTFSYFSYKRRYKHRGSTDGGLRPMSLVEYTQTVIMDESRHSPVCWVLCAGIFWCVMALLIAFLMAY